MSSGNPVNYDITSDVDYHDYQFDSLVATTLDKTRKTLTNQITSKNVLLAWLNSKGQMIDGGLTIREPLIYDYNSTVGSYSMYDLLDSTPQAGLGFAQYEYFSFAGAVTVAGEEIDKNSGASQLISLLSAKVEQLNFTFDRWLNRVLWGTQPTVNAALDLISIPEIVNSVDPGANTTTTCPNRGGAFNLGGIDYAATNAEGSTYWQSNVVAYTAPLDLTTLDGTKKLNKMLNDLDVVGSRPDLEITSQTNVEAYEFQTLDKTLRYTSTKMADLGFDSVAHKGAEIAWDKEVENIPTYATSLSHPWYFLNSNHLQFLKHSNTWMRPTGFQRPYNQDAKVNYVLSRGQLITNCRRAHGVIQKVVNA